MLNTIKNNGESWISSIEFFDNAGFSEKTRYSDWAKKNILKNPYCIEDNEYVVSKRHIINKVGKPRQEYLLKADFAYKLAMQVSTSGGEQLREYLLQMLKKVENKDLITIEEAGLAANFINYYKYVDNQKTIERKYLNLFETDFAQGHKKRNMSLDIAMEKVKKEYLAWCVENGQVAHKGLNKTSMINCYNKYYLIRMALWDYCKANGLSEPAKFPTVVLKICDAMKVNILPRNEVNFFQTIETIEQLPLTIESGLQLLSGGA